MHASRWPACIPPHAIPHTRTTFPPRPTSSSQPLPGPPPSPLSSPQTCTPADQFFYAGGLHNRISAGCSYIMVTAACKPSTCAVDTSINAASSLATALGSTGRITRQQLKATRAYSKSISGTAAAVIGGIVGAVLLVTAALVGFLLFRRSTRPEHLLAGRMGSHSSIAADYLDADQPDSFSPAAMQARRASRLSQLMSYLPRPSELRAQGRGRFSDKHGIPEDSPVTGAAAGTGASPGGADSVATPTTGRVGGAGLVSTPAALRMPSMFGGGRTASIFAPRSAATGGPSPYSNMSITSPRLATSSTIALPTPRTATARGGGLAGSVVNSPDALTIAEHPELAPPEEVANVFLNPLAIMRGGNRDRSGAASPRVSSSGMYDMFANAIRGGGNRASRAPEPGHETPLIHMTLDENAATEGTPSRPGARYRSTNRPGPVAEATEPSYSYGGALYEGAYEQLAAAPSPWAGSSLRSVIPAPPPLVIPPPVDAAALAAALAAGGSRTTSGSGASGSARSRSPIAHASPVMPCSPR